MWQREQNRQLSYVQGRWQLSRAVSVDSTTVVGHVDAAGLQRDGVNRHPAEPADHSFGRSLGRWSIGSHLGIETGRWVMPLVLTVGWASDWPQMVPVLDKIWGPLTTSRRLQTPSERLLRNEAQSFPANRAWLNGRRIRAGICQPQDQLLNLRRRG